MLTIAARVGYGVMAGLRVLWICWAGLGLAISAWEIRIGVPLGYVAIAVTCFVVLPIAVIVHEIGHAWAAAALGLTGLRLERSGLSVAVVCPSASGREDAMVAAGGPMLCAALAVFLFCAEYVWASGYLIAPCLIVGGGALSILPFTGDGRVFWTWAWSSISSVRAE